MDVIRENYADVLFERDFLGFIVNSIIVTGCSVAIALVLGVPAAYAFSRYRFRGKDRWASTILSFRFMPPIAVAIPILLMMRRVGLTDTKPGLVIPYVAFSLPLVIWIMIGFFDEVPRDLDAAAALDGCGRGARWSGCSCRSCARASSSRRSSPASSSGTSSSSGCT